MFDTMHGRIVVLKPPAPPDDAATGPDSLQPDALQPDAIRQRCLHPAELWVLKRRAGRPQAAPSRLPAVARVG